MLRFCFDAGLDFHRLDGASAINDPEIIPNELNDPEIIPNCRRWQVRFWKEASLRWNPPQWNQPAGQARLLQHACTGAGKSDIIVMAPFAGARERCLVLVPTNAILEDLKVALGAPQQGIPNQQPDEQATTARAVMTGLQSRTSTLRTRACSTMSCSTRAAALLRCPDFTGQRHPACCCSSQGF